MDTWKCNPSKDQPRKIFEIEVGNLTPEEAEENLKRYKCMFKAAIDHPEVITDEIDREIIEKIKKIVDNDKN